MVSMDSLRQKSLLPFKTVLGLLAVLSWSAMLDALLLLNLVIAPWGSANSGRTSPKTLVSILQHWAAGAAKTGLLAVWSWSAILDALLLLHLVIAPWSSANSGRTSCKVPLHRKGLRRCPVATLATRSVIKSTRVIAVNSSRSSRVEGGMIELSVSQNLNPCLFL